MTAAQKLENNNEFNFVQSAEDRFPEVLVFGLPNCKKCHSLCDKLEKHLSIPFTFIDWSTQDVTQFDWRNTSAVDFLADVSLRDIDMTHPPVVSISGVAYDYAGAIKELKRIKENKR